MKKLLVGLLIVVMMFGATLNTLAFSDVATGSKYREAADKLSNLGIINGYENGTFLPGNNINRMEFSKMIICYSFLRSTIRVME